VWYNSHPVTIAQTKTSGGWPTMDHHKAILTLANGRKIGLGDAKNGLIAEDGGAAIQKARDGKIVYGNHSAEPAGQPVAANLYNTIEVPRGGEYQLVLSDGTKVWLNSQSTLRYPTKFNAHERSVELVGEAYFEVVHNEKQPFTVHTHHQNVVVLGTHFNIKAYGETEAFTTLQQGRIKVSNLLSDQSRILSPGKQSITRTDGTISVADVDAEEAIAWKSGFFIFDNQDIETIMMMISRWYDVDVEYKNVGKNIRIGGTFSKKSGLNELLKNLETIAHVHFELKGHKVIVSK
jgi:ferric-dicitrate binding protein FerR (iron transport regulator)